MGAASLPSVLVIGVYLCDKDNQAPAIVGELARSRQWRVDQRWIALGEHPVPQVLAVATVGQRHATPLLVTLLFVELSDILFAVDSVPAIFAISQEPLIVFTSNVFAILGLRAMYFLLAGAIERFHLLKYALALILIFVGLKMVWLNDAFGGKFPIEWSLAIIGSLLGGAIVVSWLLPARHSLPHPR